MQEYEKIYYNFNIDKEFKVYKNVGSRSKDGIHNYLQWRNHITKCRCNNEDYNTNFYHYLIHEIRVAECYVETSQIFTIPFEIAMISLFATLAKDELNNVIALGLFGIIVVVLVYLICSVVNQKNKITFLKDSCDILFDKYKLN